MIDPRSAHPRFNAAGTLSHQPLRVENARKPITGLDNAIKRTGALKFLQIVLAPNEMASQSKREHRLIEVAPTPLLSKFNGAHQWMAGRMKVFCSVFVL